MPFFDSLSGQFNAGVGGIPDDEARYAANLAKRLALARPSGQGAIPDDEARYAANVARRLGPPAVSGPAPDAVEAVISRGQPDGVVAPTGFRPMLIARPLEPISPAEHPAVKKRLAQITDPQALAEVQRAGNALARPSDRIALEPSAVADQPIEDRRLFPTDVTGPAARYAANVARRLGRPTPMERYGVPDIAPPAVPQAGLGFLAHLKGALEGLGAGLGTGHPLGGAIMGVAGGVNPHLGANAWYNDVTLPMWEQQTANSLDLAGKRLGIVEKIAAITGINPVTGEPTAAQEKENALEGYRDALNGLKASHDDIINALGEGRLNQLQANLLFHQ